MTSRIGRSPSGARRSGRADRRGETPIRRPTGPHPARDEARYAKRISLPGVPGWRRSHQTAALGGRRQTSLVGLPVPARSVLAVVVATPRAEREQVAGADLGPPQRAAGVGRRPGPVVALVVEPPRAREPVAPERFGEAEDL